jgi:hypothetical protein
MMESDVPLPAWVMWGAWILLWHSACLLVFLLA